MPDHAIGGIPEADIEEHYKAQGIPRDAGADRVIRFLRTLTDLLSQRWAAGEPHDGAVFLLAEKVADVMASRKGTSKPALVTGNDEISGRVWVVNARLGNAHALEVAWVTGEGFEEINDGGLGDLPAVAIDLRDKTKGPQALFFPDGCGAPDAMLRVHLGEDPIDDAHMKDTLDEFYESNLRTPMTIAEGHGDKVWKEARTGVPNPRPEETIEGLLLRHLNAVYVKHHARAQTPTEDGYLDIAIEYIDRTVQGHPAKRYDWLLELKALADKTSTDKTSTADVGEAVKKGLRQAIAYSKDLPALARALCIYDLREVANDDESCFDEIREDAADHQVHLWRWRLLRSAEEGRVERYPLKADKLSKKSGGASA